MKKALLLFFAMLLTTAGFAQGVIALFSRSEEFFSLMNEQKFKEAQAYFDTVAQKQTTPEKLGEIWGSLTSNLGKFTSLDLVQSSVQGDYYYVAADGNFEKATQGFTLIFNKGQKLVGLRPRERAVESEYQIPSYADTTLFKQIEVHVKTPGHDLVGLLTIPKNGSNFPLVVFVHGSGPSDMDETVGPNKPFKDIAGGLASKGIASIRYVKRTVLYANEFTTSFTVKEEVMDDALAAIALARTTPNIDKGQIYVFGHSIGGMLAPRLALLAPDLNGIILAAAPARKLADIIADQNKYGASLAKDTTGLVAKQLTEALKKVDAARITSLGTMKADSVVLGLPAAYWVDLNNYNQVEDAKKLGKQRILVIQGGLDFQVSEQDFNIWNTALSTKKNASMKLYPDLNHLLSPQNEKGTMSQYQVPINVSAVLVNDLVTWINSN
ncbi:hypothetical protein PBAL39_23602 [Pedobacter sp. BAL39]|uniref:DUF3887 domain-containing protein n=1 Tax=Pedobacter sp. BAL39 TaxID=391596 RepID=UPI000155931F|nr:DUF3887 domain-containing protein [Pedobacter sp. BAL39]EDM36046.1 hypothetical protein PBAL39_23602 [Pedobacter sp. BAL39]